RVSPEILSTKHLCSVPLLVFVRIQFARRCLYLIIVPLVWLWYIPHTFSERKRLGDQMLKSRTTVWRQMKRIGLGILVMLAIAVTGHAQTLGTINGLIKDTSGAVLPGVSVEVASPALIEKIRSAV